MTKQPMRRWKSRAPIYCTRNAKGETAIRINRELVELMAMRTGDPVVVAIERREPAGRLYWSVRHSDRSYRRIGKPLRNGSVRIFCHALGLDDPPRHEVIRWEIEATQLRFITEPMDVSDERMEQAERARTNAEKRAAKRWSTRDPFAGETQRHAGLGHGKKFAPDFMTAAERRRQLRPPFWVRIWRVLFSDRPEW